MRRAISVKADQAAAAAARQEMQVAQEEHQTDDGDNLSELLIVEACVKHKGWFVFDLNLIFEAVL